MKFSRATLAICHKHFFKNKYLSDISLYFEKFILFVWLSLTMYFPSNSGIKD